MPCLLTRYFAQIKHLNALEHQAGRKGDVRLLAVSKTKPVADIYRLYQVGQRDFGENYLQEAVQKQRALAHLAINWHFIGPIQSNKTREIASRFQWVHSIDRVKIAQRLNDQRPSHLPPLNICLQVNISEEKTKSGFLLDEIEQAAKAIAELDKVRLRGLMAIPASTDVLEEQKAAFKQLRLAKDNLNKQLALAADTLSMGMSNDLEAAVTEGATIVRVGTGVFGQRSS